MMHITDIHFGGGGERLNANLMVCQSFKVFLSKLFVLLSSEITKMM